MDHGLHADRFLLPLARRRHTQTPPSPPELLTFGSMDSLVGTTGDVRLPNRATARQPSPRRGAGEINSIRTELADMQRTLAREMEDEKGQRELEDEVTSLYHELQRAAAKLENEKAQRKRAEAELESIRQTRLRETTDVVQELERKRAELNTLREERSVMKEWLDRGVSECRRVAEEVVRLKSEMETSERSNAVLAKDKQRLAATIQQLSDELSTVQLALEKVHHEKAVLELRGEEATTAMSRAEEARKTTMSECDRLSAEVVRLSQRVRGLEDAELSMQAMCSCLESLAKEVSVMEAGVAAGDLDRSVDDVRPPLHEAANNIAQPKALSAMVVEARRLLQVVQDAVGRVRGAVKRFVANKQRTVSEMTAQHRMEMDALQTERDTTIATLRTEADGLRQRIADLEREIVMVADGVQRDVRVEASDRLAVLDKVTGTNRDLSSQIEALQLENDRLKTKAKRMKIDWTKVDESRRRYQQLQMEVTLMQESMQQLQTENRNLRLMVDGGNLGASTGGHASTGRSGRPTTTEPVAFRQAFEEWRQSAATRM